MTHFRFLPFLLLLPALVPAQAPVITAVSPAATNVEQYGKFEIALTLTAGYTNPYDYDDIRVQATFTAPSGAQRTVDGFFMENFTLNTQLGSLSAAGNGQFKVRFAPDEPGAWSYAVSCTNAAGTGNFPAQSFQCTPAGTGNHGFIRAGQSNYLSFDDGQQYVAVGENMAWATTNSYLDYKKWLDQLAGQGGNFIRVWNCHWGLGLEWSAAGGYPGLKRYHQANGFYLDWLFEYCAERGVYVMLCLNHHGQVSSNVNPNWNESPYNSANGGPCAHTWDFFTQSGAKNLLKNRLRYVVARWGYQRSVMAWELFNEVDWTDNFPTYKTAVADWHAEMAAYLKQLDPNNHLVTTSYAIDSNDPAVWNIPDIDLTQTHYYISAPNLERALATGVRAYLQAYGKPTLTAEFGLSGNSSDLPVLDPTGVYIHNSLWGALYGGGLGTGMTWWWDNYIEPQNLYTHFQGVGAVSQATNFEQADLRPAAASVNGVPGDLQLTPTLGWSALADTSFNIAADGTVTPATGQLSTFLYGAQWNTQYRRPPVFHVNFPANGQFSVKIGNVIATSPKISIWLDGVVQLNSAAAANQVFSINVPAGLHTIKVDNTGTDWMLIAQYAFSNLGSAVDAYVLRAESGQSAAGWLLNNRFNYAYLQANGMPPVATGAVVKITDLTNGDYALRWFDCATGAVVQTNTVTATNGVALLPAPAFQWDLAFALSQGLSPTREPFVQALDFEVYPNPATDGQAALRLPSDIRGSEPASISLLDATGRLLAQWQAIVDNNELPVRPGRAPAPGVYFIRLDYQGRTGVRPLLIP